MGDVVAVEVDQVGADGGGEFSGLDVGLDEGFTEFLAFFGRNEGFEGGGDRPADGIITGGEGMEPGAFGDAAGSAVVVALGRSRFDAEIVAKGFKKMVFVGDQVFKEKDPQLFRGEVG